ncbi:MAG TPA: hypothetical protein VE988_29880 [Gemmataceae bacterium]|nr:hypothetical protein [Gemmataceae bacterium]
MIFIESYWFTKSITERLDDEQFAELQMELLANPEVGKVMPGCGGLRKIRFSDPKRGKGKRGGVRLIYVCVPEVSWILLLDLYDKGEKEDISAQDKKTLKHLAEEFKAEANWALIRERRMKDHE